MIEDFELLSKAVQDAIDELYLFEDRHGSTKSVDILKLADYIDEMMARIEMDITEDE